LVEKILDLTYPEIDLITILVERYKLRELIEKYLLLFYREFCSGTP